MLPPDLAQEIWLYLNREKPTLELIYLILGSTVALGSIIYTAWVILRKISHHLSQYLHGRDKPPQQTEENDTNLPQQSIAPPPPNSTSEQPEIRALSHEYCPQNGPYYIFEHPHIVKSFIKGQKMPMHSQGITLETVTWIYIPPAQLAQRKSYFIPPAKSPPNPEQPQPEERPPAPKDGLLGTRPIHDHILFNILEHIQKQPSSPNFSDVPGVSSNSELTHHIDHCIRMEYINGTYNSTRQLALFTITPAGQAQLAKLAFHRQSMPNILLEICQMLDNKFGRYTILNFEDIPGNHDKQTIITNLQNGINQKYIEGTYDEETQTAQIKLTAHGIQELEKI